VTEDHGRTDIAPLAGIGGSCPTPDFPWDEGCLKGWISHPEWVKQSLQHFTLRPPRDSRAVSSAQDGQKGPHDLGVERLMEPAGPERHVHQLIQPASAEVKFSVGMLNDLWS
jgi:hypothetical protein